MSEPVTALRTAIEPLLDNARRAGTVRAGVRSDEVVALLSATCQGATVGDGNADLRERTLRIVFSGLRPA